MDKYRVPQRRIPVRVELRDGALLAGEMFAPATGPDGAPGRLSERLNDDQLRFVPLVSGASSVLVHKVALISVELPEEERRHELPDGMTRSEVQVQLRLEGGRRLEGSLHYSMPKGRERLLDFVNAAEEFVVLVRGGQLVLIRRDAIEIVEDKLHASHPDPRLNHPERT